MTIRELMKETVITAKEYSSKACQKVADAARNNPELTKAIVFTTIVTAADATKHAVRAKANERRMHKKGYYDARRHCWYHLRRPLKDSEQYVLSRRVAKGYDAYEELMRMGLLD